MAGGYADPPGAGLDVLAREIADLRDRLSELEAPTASQMYSSLDHITESTILPVEIMRIDNSPSISATLAAEFATVNTTVPAGFTRALVSFTVAARLRSNEAGGSDALMTVSPTVEGTPQLTIWGTIFGQKYGTVSAPATEVLQGLTGGDVITVGAMVAFPGTYNLPQVIVSGSILFLR